MVFFEYSQRDVNLGDKKSYCRDNVWGFDEVVVYLRQLSDLDRTKTSQEIGPISLQAEVLHDEIAAGAFSESLYERGLAASSLSDLHCCVIRRNWKQKYTGISTTHYYDFTLEVIFSTPQSKSKFQHLIRMGGGNFIQPPFFHSDWKDICSFLSCDSGRPKFHKKLKIEAWIHRLQMPANIDKKGVTQNASTHTTSS